MTRVSTHPGHALALLAVGLAAMAFWESPLLLPFKLLAVMGHETGHALAALLVGGSVKAVSLTPAEAGQCLSLVPEGTWGRIVVASGGYVGGAAAAVALLWATFRLGAEKAVLAAACAWLAAMGLLLADDAFTVAFCLVTAAAFAAAARLLPAAAAGAVNAFLAGFQALYAVRDLFDDLWRPEVRAQSDAAILAASTGVPALAWAVLWTLASLGLLAFALVLLWRAPPPRRPAERARQQARSGA